MTWSWCNSTATCNPLIHLQTRRPFPHSTFANVGAPSTTRPTTSAVHAAFAATLGDCSTAEIPWREHTSTIWLQWGPARTSCNGRSTHFKTINTFQNNFNTGLILTHSYCYMLLIDIVILCQWLGSFGPKKERPKTLATLQISFSIQ